MDQFCFIFVVAKSTEGGTVKEETMERADMAVAVLFLLIKQTFLFTASKS